MRNDAGPVRLKSALVLVVLKALVSGAVLASGFRSVSDDDFARVVIAQEFARAPAWDPSQTSWLPLPFWLNGAATLLLGRDLWVARGVAVLLGIAATLAVWVAARWLGASRSGALVGAGLAAAFPYSALLGVATVPEAHAAALMTLGAAGIAGNGSQSVRAFAGALALGAACLCRYEAWPVALAGAGVLAVRAAKAREAPLFAAALVAVLPAGLWLLHGKLAFGNAFFFVDRVAAYKHALGGSESWGSALTRYPFDLFLHEPELLLALCVAVAVVWRAGLRAELARYALFALMLASIPLFLTAGALRGGAPTHHGERALLALWFACAVVIGDLVTSAARRFGWRPRARLAAALAMAVLAGSLFVRPNVARETFVDRRYEAEIGTRARAFLSSDGKLAIATNDFGFFAVVAGLGRPEQTVVLRRHDPRQGEPALDFEDTERLAQTLRNAGATLFAAPREHAPAARRLGSPVALNARLVLIDLE